MMIKLKFPLRNMKGNRSELLRVVGEDGTVQLEELHAYEFAIKPSDRFVKTFTGDLGKKLYEAGGQATILLMYIVCSGMLEYGTNCFSFNKLRKIEITNTLGVKIGAIYKSLRRLKAIGLVEMNGVGNYIVNRKYFEYGRSTKDWKKMVDEYRGSGAQHSGGESDGESSEIRNDLPLS